MRPRVVDWLLDRVWDVTLPLTSTCPVCTFWRGAGAGAVLAFACVLLGKALW